MALFFVAVFPPVPAPGFYVRVVVIYRQPDHYREIIERCPNHITKQKDGEFLCLNSQIQLLNLSLSFKLIISYSPKFRTPSGSRKSLHNCSWPLTSVRSEGFYCIYLFIVSLAHQHSTTVSLKTSCFVVIIL